MIFTIEDIKKLYLPVFAKYGVTDVWLFGSTARGENNSASDVDFLYDRPESFINDPFLAMDLLEDLMNVSDKEIDLVTVQDLTRVRGGLYGSVMKERIKLS